MAHERSRRLAVPALAGAAALPAAAAGAATGPFEVVYRPNQPGGEDFACYEQMLANIQNRPSIAPPWGLEIRVVMHGPGVDLLRRAAPADKQITATIDDLEAAGVQFRICAITSKRGDIPLSRLCDAEEADLVPLGVFEIARLQRREGFAYLKI